MSQNTPIKPWYKHVWPWVLMAGPIFVVIASVAMFLSRNSTRQIWLRTII
ncbi:hypothetical protein NEIMUCOT_06703, partial [Neisseria mucosa ATCC 25996]